MKIEYLGNFMLVFSVCFEFKEMKVYVTFYKGLGICMVFCVCVLDHDYA